MSAKIELKKIGEFVKTDNCLEKIIIVCFDEYNYSAYSKLMSSNQ